MPGSVWTIPTEPLKVPDHLGIDHFAAFPTEWPKRIIQGWSPATIQEDSCDTTSSTPPMALADTSPSAPADGGVSSTRGSRTPSRPTPTTQRAVVLDPFGGTGTTAMVAKALGRHGISVDMSADYCRLAEWRTNDRNQLAKVLGVAKVDDVDPEQLDLFGGAA